MIMPEMDGIKLLDWLRNHDPKSPYYGHRNPTTFPTALEAIRRGAYDYILKPFEKDQLFLGVGRALQHRRLVLENKSYQFKSATAGGRAHPAAHRGDHPTRTILRRHSRSSRQRPGLEGRRNRRALQRVTAFTISIAKAVPVPLPYLPVLARAAFLHDIGKMAIPDMILRKPGPLDNDEKDHHAHPLRNRLQHADQDSFSSRRRGDRPGPPGIFLMGTGYPRGLRGEQIPLGARIFSLADAMTR